MPGKKREPLEYTDFVYGIQKPYKCQEVDLFDFWEKARGFKSEIPNKFTIEMGELIRKARMEAKLTQGELAVKAIMRQATVSDIENGKREATASELVSLSASLEKPVGYFFPWYAKYVDDDGKLGVLEQELLIHARKLSDDDLRKIIAQVKALADMPSEKTPIRGK